MFTNDPTYYFTEEGSWYKLFLLVTHVYFSLDFLIRLISAPKTQRFALSLSSALEVITSFPMCFFYFFFEIESTPFRAVMMLDPWRLYLNKRVLKHIDSEILREMMQIINNAIFLIMMSTSYMQFVESNGVFPEPMPNFSTNETIFFIMTSYTFIGYGSYAVTIEGRVFMIVMILLAFVGIPG
jgi:hypothetical protein